MQQPHISIVSTLYHSAPFLDNFIAACLDALKTINCSSFEFVFVNDGSPDNSVEILLGHQQRNKAITIVDLSRNFGHHRAIQAGLGQAKGDYVFLIDCDMETAPSVLSLFYVELMGNKFDVVYGYQENRKGKLMEKWSGQFFWKGINALSETKIPANILTERLMTQEYVQALLTMGDHNVFLGGMMHWVGFEQKGVVVTKGLREGKSTYSTRKRLNLMVNAITSFSAKPLEIVFYIGLLISMLSFLIGGFLIIQKTIYGDLVSVGWTSLIVINIFILGIQTTFLGILGIYIGKIFSQIQGRPNYIIKNIHKHED